MTTSNLIVVGNNFDEFAYGQGKQLFAFVYQRPPCRLLN